MYKGSSLKQALPTPTISSLYDLRPTVLKNTNEKLGQKYNSVIVHLPSMHEAFPEPNKFHILPKGARNKQGMLAQAYNPRTEAEGLFKVHHQPGLLSETLSQQTK